MVFVGILVIALIAAAYWGIGRGINRGAAIVGGAVTGNTRTRGLAAVHNGLEFAVPVPGRAVIERVMETLELGPTYRDNLKLEGVDAEWSSMAVTVGSNWKETAKYLLTTEPTDAGCRGLATVMSWTEVEGRIPATEAIERLQKHIRSAVAHLGGTVEERVTR